MDKIKNSLSYGLLFAFLGKLMFVSASVADMGIVFALSSICALQFYLEKNSKLQDVVETVNTQNKVIEQMAMEVAKMRDSVSSIKLQSGFKKVV